MIAASLFSGIGAPECAMPHWQWAWCAEIEKFPSAVLAARHPQSVNLGDVTAHDFAERAAKVARPDIIVFGSPCQGFSVAGKRLGLDDPRSNLALCALGIVAQLRPRWFVFENVPGLFSSFSGSEQAEREVREGPVGREGSGAEDRDFAAFLSAVSNIGYSGAWTVLDAQWRGVAQRRERVFFVGHIGDWRYPTAVLLEPESLSGDSPPSRKAGERPAPTTAARTKGGGGLGTDFDCDGGLIHAPVVSPALKSRDCKGPSSDGDGDGDGAPLIAHALRAEGFDAGEDGTGRGTPIVPVAFDCKASGRNGFGVGDVAPTLRAMGHKDTHQNAGGQVAIAFDTTQIRSKENRCQPEDGKPCHPLAAEAHAPAVAFDLRGREEGARFEGPHDTANIRAASGGSSKSYIAQSWKVRRLTPRECERLQGFPDDFTAITIKGKVAAAGPRYRALGNSMAVPIVRLILERIEMLEAMLRRDKAP